MLVTADTTICVSFQVDGQQVQCALPLKRGEDLNDRLQSLYAQVNVPVYKHTAIASAVHQLLGEELRVVTQHALAAKDSVSQVGEWSTQFKTQTLVWNSDLAPSTTVSREYLSSGGGGQGGSSEDIHVTLAHGSRDRIFPGAYQCLVASEQGSDLVHSWEEEDVRVINLALADHERAVADIRQNDSSAVIELQDAERNWKKTLGELEGKHRDRFRRKVLQYAKANSMKGIPGTHPSRDSQLANTSSTLPHATSAGNDDDDDDIPWVFVRDPRTTFPGFADTYATDAKSHPFANTNGRRHKPSTSSGVSITSTASLAADPTPRIYTLPPEPECRVLKRQVGDCEVLLLECSPLDVCTRKATSVESGEGNEAVPDPQRVHTLSTLYTENLSALVLPVDTDLAFSSPWSKDFIQSCNAFPEYHFESVETQVEAIREVCLDQAFQTGDFFVTRHSNIRGTHMVFHVGAHPRDLSADASSPFISALAQVLHAAQQATVRTIYIPLLLMESQSGSASSLSNASYQRIDAIIQCVRDHIDRTQSATGPGHSAGGVGSSGGGTAASDLPVSQCTTSVRFLTTSEFPALSKRVATVFPTPTVPGRRGTHV